ncbi:MAG: (5-formylfuran-3-yl)methyl phosphate synthase [Pirellulales bacterium]
MLDAGATFKCRAALLDTLEKRRGSLTEQWTDEQIAAFVRGAHDRGMWAVIGGSLTVESIPSVVRLGADIIAVRGAACRARREGTIDPDRVACLAATVRMCANAIC